MQTARSTLLDILDRDQLLDTMPSGLFLVDCDRVIVHWNREAERVTGYSAAEAVGQHCSFLEGIECGSGCGLYDPDTPDKPIIGASCRIRAKDGRLLYILKNIDLLRHDGEVIGGIESFIDVTEQKNLEEELRRHGDELEVTVRERTAALDEERNRLRSVLDAMTDFAYIVSADFRLCFINKAMRDRLGAVEGEACYRALHELQGPCANCPLQQTLDGATVLEERTFTRNENTYEIIHTPLYSPQGEREKLAVCRDITERNEAAARLREANRQLDAFVYTVSHDLRSPLTPIIGFAEFLQHEYRDRLDDQGINLLQEIESQGNRMLSLMEDLLQLSRVGHLPPPEQPVDSAGVVRNVMTDLAAEIADKRVRIDLIDLPALRVPESLFEELLSNLLRNALRYGCEEGGLIEIRGRQKIGLVQLQVIDHGPGIPDKEKERVFDVFFRGATGKQHPGTGIGLATVQKIVRQYDGKVRLTDTPGGGCTFTLQFPQPAGTE